LLFFVYLRNVGLSTDFQPKRSEVWLVNLEPTLGAEIRKTRPVVVISSNSIGKLPIKLVVPITDWKTSFARNLWHIQLEPDDENGLTKVSAIDTLQLRGVDTQRFIRKLGKLSSEKVAEVALVIAAVIELQPED